MKPQIQKILTTSLVLTITGFTAHALAQEQVGTLTHGPSATSVPTLGGYALILLAVLLGLVAFRTMRTRQHNGASLVVALTAILAIASGVGGVNLVSEAWAGNPNMENPDGDDVKLYTGETEVKNNTGISQKIRSVELIEDCNFDKDEIRGEGPCMYLPTVPSGGFCTTAISCTPK